MNKPGNEIVPKPPFRPYRPLVYLAAPYTHPDHEVMAARYHQANRAAAALVMAGLSVFSPVSMTHSIHQDAVFPHDFSFWEKLDTDFLSVCSALYVLTIDGWKESKGVQAEIKIAEEMRLPVYYGEWTVIKQEQPDGNPDPDPDPA